MRRDRRVSRRNPRGCDRVEASPQPLFAAPPVHEQRDGTPCCSIEENARPLPGLRELRARPQAIERPAFDAKRQLGRTEVPRDARLER